MSYGTISRVKYNELLSNFNELQSEKAAIQQQLESGFSHVKTVDANIKVLCACISTPH